MLSDAKNVKRGFAEGARYAILCLLSVGFLLPFVWMMVTALKPLNQVFTYPIQWIPRPFVWKNFAVGWSKLPFTTYLRNTVLVTGFGILGTVMSCSLVAYGFARLRFPGKNALFLVLMATMMLPMQVTIIPLFLIYRKIGWIDTLYPLIVPAFFAGNPFFVFLLRQFFLTISPELEDAAKIDGCNSFTIFTRIFLPLSKPAQVSVLIFSFMHFWNDFFLPLIFLNSESRKTLSLGLADLKGLYYTEWNLVMAVTVLSVLPCAVLFLACQKYFVTGIATSGLKG